VSQACIRSETKRKSPDFGCRRLATIRGVLSKLTVVTVVIAALEFLTRCAVEVISLQAESAAKAKVHS